MTGFTNKEEIKQSQSLAFSNNFVVVNKHMISSFFYT